MSFSSIGEEELLTGFAAWLRWLKNKRGDLEGKQAKLERRMSRNGDAEPAATTVLTDEPVSQSVSQSVSAPETDSPAPALDQQPADAPLQEEEAPSPPDDDAVDDWL